MVLMQITQTRIHNLHPKNTNAERLGNFIPVGKKTISQGERRRTQVGTKEERKENKGK